MVICVIGGISLAVLLITVVLLAAGVILIGLGIGKLFTFPIAGMMIGGIGLAVLAFGMLFVMADGPGMRESCSRRDPYDWKLFQLSVREAAERGCPRVKRLRRSAFGPARSVLFWDSF